MKVLIVKTSSLGDVLHTLPAVTDATRAVPEIRFDWVVEESLAEIPQWHCAVDRVIPVATRRWRKRMTKAIADSELSRFHHTLKAREYDIIIDAQGLLKSAVITRMARGVRCGFDNASAKEPLLGFAYHRRYSVTKDQHAVDRVRQLFASALQYPVPTTLSDYGLDKTYFFSRATRSDAYVVFLHGTTWRSKLWPETYWVKLTQLADQAGFTVYLPWGSDVEQERAERVAETAERSRALPGMNLNDMAAMLVGAHAVIGVDTGLGHLAAALGVPVVTIYGATDPGLTGTQGRRSVNISASLGCSPCFNRRCTFTGTAEVTPACYATLPAPAVWTEAEKSMHRQREAINQ